MKKINHGPLMSSDDFRPARRAFLKQLSRFCQGAALIGGASSIAPLLTACTAPFLGDEAISAPQPDAPCQWQGRLMGGEVFITLYPRAGDRKEAEQAISEAVLEARRLERVFSLYEPDSEISRLNRDGYLMQASEDFLRLFSFAGQIWQKTQGLFDPTIQPLFAFWANHYARRPEGRDPDPALLEKALATIGFDKIKQEGPKISFARPDMALSLNGVAQGYISDQIADRLIEKGFSSGLVNMGEYRALGPKIDADGVQLPWQIGLVDARAPWQLLTTVPLSEGGLATSSPSGAAFTKDGRRHHLLHPLNGSSPVHYETISVKAPTALLADALSTSLSLVPFEEIAAFMAPFKGVDILLQRGDQLTSLNF